MVGWNSETGWWFSWTGALLFSIALVATAWNIARRRRRKKTLSHNGKVYVWIEFDGSEKSSEIHPEAPGGAWHGDGDGDGDGDGGD